MTSATISATEEIVANTWDMTSLTVYGALVTLLVVAIILLWRDNRANSSKLFAILESNIAVIHTFTSKFDGDGAVLRDKQLEATVRGVVQSELQGVAKDLEDLKKRR